MALQHHFGFSIQLGLTKKTENKNIVPSGQNTDHSSSKKPSVNPLTSSESSLSSTAISKATTKKTPSEKHFDDQTGLNRNFTFDNLVKGKANELAFSAAQQVLEHPGKIYNPLFIYGATSLGKTHLIQAVGNKIHEMHADIRLRYIDSESFYREYSRAIAKNNIDEFKRYFHTLDFFLIDDIQFLGKKFSTQDEFFHTFNALLARNKQIIITSDKPPKKIGGLEERLKSRFESGLVADIQPPELETKIEIIKKKCEINRVKLDREVINYVATIIENNTREIEGILSKLNAYSQLMGVDITIEFARNVLKEQMAEKRSNITIDLIMDIVAKELNIKPSEIRSKSRNSNIVYARRIAIYLSRSLTPNSMPQLAQYFGMKDHTAVSHTMKKIQELMKNDEDFRIKVEELSNKVSVATSE